MPGRRIPNPLQQIDGTTIKVRRIFMINLQCPVALQETRAVLDRFRFFWRRCSSLSSWRGGDDAHVCEGIESIANQFLGADGVGF